MNKFFILCILFFFNIATPVYAGLIEYEFSGIFSRAVLVDSNASLDVNIDDVFQVSFGFEANEALFSLIDNDTRARYNTGYIAAETGVNNYYANEAPQLQILNDWEFSLGGTVIDEFFLSAFQYDNDGDSFYLLQLNMRDYTNNIINNTSIPTTAQIETLSGNGGFFLRRFSANNNEEWWADGIFSEITLVSVPEPTGIILFFSGLVMLIVRVKKT